MAYRLSTGLLHYPPRRGDRAPRISSTGLFVIAAATVLLLFIGIHNAWDNLTYVAIELSQPENKRQDQ